MNPEETHERIVALLREGGARFIVHAHEPAVTVAESIERLPFPFEQYLKTVVFTAGDGLVLAAMRGKDRVDYRLLAGALGVRRAELRQAAPEEIEAALGMPLGGVCPLPLAPGSRVVVDRQALELETVFCGAGRAGRTLEVALPDLLRLADALVAPIVREPS